MGWSVLVPVRSGGKTRLTAPGDWGRACALDTVAAIAACPLVEEVVILGDLESHLRVEADTNTGLNNEISRVAAQMSRPLAVILGDLPSLTSEDLADVLTQATKQERALVIDHTGTGTTMVTVTTAGLTTCFGQNSAKRHQAAGFVPLSASARSTTDVDTLEDLTRAAALGLGKETQKLFDLL